MDLSALDASLREQVAAFIAVPARLNAVGGRLARLARTRGVPQGTASTISNALDNVTQIRAAQLDVEGRLAPLVSALASTPELIGKIGISAAIGAVIPAAVTVLARTRDVEGTTAAIEQQVAGMGLQVSADIPASAWAIGAGLVALAAFAYKRR